MQVNYFAREYAENAFVEIHNRIISAFIFVDNVVSV